MDKKFYVIKAEKPAAHYIISMTNEELNGAKTFLNGISNPEYAMGHSGTKFTIYEPGYNTKEEAEEFISSLLF